MKTVLLFFHLMTAFLSLRSVIWSGLLNSPNIQSNIDCRQSFSLVNLPFVANKTEIINSIHLFTQIHQNGKQQSLFLQVMTRAEKFIEETYFKKIWELALFYMDPFRCSKKYLMWFVFLVLVELNCNRSNSSFDCLSVSFLKWFNFKLGKNFDVPLNIYLLIQCK